MCIVGPIYYALRNSDDVNDSEYEHGDDNDRDDDDDDVATTTTRGDIKNTTEITAVCRGI